MLEPGPGTTSEALYLEPRITVTTQDSSPGIQRSWMANPSSEEPYALMCARTDLWEPRVATPGATRPREVCGESGSSDMSATPSKLRAFQNFSGVTDFRSQDVVLHSQPPHRQGDASRL